MKLSVLLTALIILCATYAEGEDHVKPSKVDNFQPQWKGIACTKKKDGKDISEYRSRNVTISIGESKRFSFRIPKIWKPGEYICVWKIKAHRDDVFKPKPKIKIHFEKLFIAYPIDESYITMCKDKIYIRSRTKEILNRENYLCKEENGERFDTESDEATIFLEVHIPEGDKIKRKKSTRFIASVYSEINFLEPDRFNVKDIIESDNPYIKDFKFTWDNARQFCRNYVPKWDLCDWDSYACNEPHEYSHASVNISTQYIPLLDYNNWGEVIVEGSSCDTLTYRFGPPDWGTDPLKCPKTGCESKSFIYCCFYEKPVILNQVLKPKQVRIESGISAPGQYHYRFDGTVLLTREDHYYYGYYADPDIVWSEYWKTAGRITGDLKKVRLFSEHSPKAPIPLYFCSKYDGYSVEKFRFMVSMSPCAEPWTTDFYRYTRTTPYKKMRPLYFGQSRTGEGTRISFTPFCCGFDGPGSFVAYGLYKNSWKAKVHSNRCSNDTRYAANPGTITSPLFPESFEQHTDCTWQVIASPGKGISLQFKVVEFDEDWDPNCTKTYLEFSSPTQTYGRLCSSRQPVDFRTAENVLNIKYLGEGSWSGRFSINYTEISAPAKTPVKFTLPNENATWSAATNLCFKNGMQLCRKEQICPFDTQPNVRKDEDLRMIPVSNKHNDWVRGNDYSNTSFEGRFCTSILDSFAPPFWRESIINNCTKLTLQHGDPICTIIKRDIIYCCEKNESSRKESPKPVRVYIGYQWKYTSMIYRFDKDDKMYETLYKVSDDYGHNFDSTLANTELWEPPSRYHKNDSNVIDYFVASETRIKGLFDKTLFFCSQSVTHNLYVNPVVRQHKVKLSACDEDWQLDFYLFVSDKKTAETPVALRIGKSATSDSAFCCEEHSDTITIYVADAGVIDKKNPEF